MSDFRESQYWDKMLEGELPDCRLSYSERGKAQVHRGRMEMDTVFCAQCHEPKGLVPVHCPHIFFICDDCFCKMQGISPPGTVEVSEEQARKMGRP